MHRFRMFLTTIVASVLFGAATASGAMAQEEGPPMPPPGDPFAGVLSGSASFTPNDECPLGVKTVVDSAGVTTIGEVSMHAEHCATLGAPTVSDGEVTLTVDGDDQISGSYFIDCDPPLPTVPEGELITCPGRFVFTAGTGVFSEVAGTAHTSSYVWFPGTLEAQEWPWIAELHGSISY